MKLDAIKAVLTQHKRGEDGVITPDMLEAAWAEYESLVKARLPRKYIRVLRALDESGEATFDELLIRVSPMDEKDLLGTIYVLDSKALIDLSNGDGCATITDAGREALGRRYRVEDDLRRTQELLDEKREECAQLRRALNVKESGESFCLLCVLDPDHKGPCRETRPLASG